MNAQQKAMALLGPPEWESIYRVIRSDIFAFCRFLNFKPTEQQHGLLRAVQERQPRIAVRSGQGTGKSKCASVIALWRVIQQPGSRVVVTAPSMRQVQDVFLTEVRATLENGPKFFRRMFYPTARKVYVGRAGKDDEAPPDWGIIGVTATDPRNAQGYHGDNISFIVDEASGVPRGIIEQIEGTLSQAGDDKLHLQIGNPNVQDCAFYDSFTVKRKYWECFRFNALESPLVSKEHCRYIAEVYGERSDVYRVRVLGEFPTMDPNAIMALADIEACTRLKPLDFVNASSVKQFGIDLARYGSDESVIAQRLGEAIVGFETFAKTDPFQVISRAQVMQHEMGWDNEDALYVVDAGGLGQGAVEQVSRAGRRLHEFHTQGTPTQPEYYDKMSEAWFNIAKKVQRHAIALPNDRDLIRQLSTRLYQVTDKGKIRIESKADYKKRLQKAGEEGSGSPDRADAVVMACYDQAVSRMKVQGVGR